MNTIFTSYDIANRRTQASLPDGTKWLYGYDRLSQVTSGDRVDAATNEPVANGSYRYAYDGIGNRTTSQDGSNADLRNYTANSLNQYISIFSPGVIPIRGRADADAKVAVTTTVGGVSTTYVPARDGQDFSIDIPVDNSQGAVTAAVQVDALKHDGTLDLDLHRRLSGDYAVPAATPQVPTYDADGNMLSYDGWTYTWNAQDRLVSATRGTARLEFAYDYMGRRFEKKVYEANVLTKHSLFIYDGFKQIAEYDALNFNALVNNYVWQPVGLDVPLLRNGQEFYVSDANKNIVALLDTTGTVTDTYTYDPFGNCTHIGSSDNPFRFSSEYFDEETGLVYYNFRYFSSELGRWLSRDPVEEQSERNLFIFLNNNNNFVDLLGLEKFYLSSPVFDAIIDDLSGGLARYIWDAMKNSSNPRLIYNNMVMAFGPLIWANYIDMCGKLLQKKVLEIGGAYLARIYDAMDSDVNFQMSCSGSFETSIGDLSRQITLSEIYVKKMLTIFETAAGTPPFSGVPTITVWITPKPLKIKWKCLSKERLLWTVYQGDVLQDVDIKEGQAIRSLCCGCQKYR